MPNLVKIACPIKRLFIKDLVLIDWFESLCILRNKSTSKKYRKYQQIYSEVKYKKGRNP